MSDYVTINELDERKVRDLLCWPMFDETVYNDRLNQLKELCVEAVALGGPHDMLSYQVLGKGHVGVVLKALWKGIESAIKIRRTDSDRQSMNEEAELLGIANRVKVGPKLYSFSDDFLVQEILKGDYFRDWIRKNKGNTEAFRDISLDLLYQARRLDMIGLDHGELIKVRRHFIITESGPKIIDFESASLSRRAHNVESVAQSIFLNIGFTKLVNNFLDIPDKHSLIEALRNYKKNQNDFNFHIILDVCDLL